MVNYLEVDLNVYPVHCPNKGNVKLTINLLIININFKEGDNTLNPQDVFK